MSKEDLKSRERIIGRARRVDFPLNQRVKPLDVPMVFSAEKRQFSFHELHQGVGDLLELLEWPVEVADYYHYDAALVVKLNNSPVVALCSGLEVIDPYFEEPPIAALFNLTNATSENQPIVIAGKKSRVLENDFYSAGGLDISRLVRENSKGEYIELSTNGQKMFIDVLK